MTSNLGAEKITTEKRVGFGNSSNMEDSKTIMNELKKEFKPEFINRIDNIVIFNKLTTDNLIEILDIILEDLNKRIQDKKVHLKISKEAKKYIVENEIDLNYGARQLKRKVQEIIENKMAKEIVEGNLKEGNTMEFYIEGNEIKSKVNIEVRCKK